MIDFESFPEVSAVYRVWHQGQVVYVGKTKNLRKRWKNHHIFPRLIQTYGVDWTVDWVQVKPSQLSRAEAFSYRHFKPVLNHADPSANLGEPESFAAEHRPAPAKVCETTSS